MEKYIRIELLGQGTYGKVYKARTAASGNFVALKKTILTTEDEGVPPTTLREVSILRSLKSPYVVRLIEVLHTEGRGGQPILYLVFEYLDHDLKKFMHFKYGKGKPMPPDQAKHFCYQILLGLKHCHTHAILHRDLKPQNLLIDEATETIKLGDFGLGRVFTLPVSRYTHEVVTLWYRAPEILLGTRYYSTGVDIWSVGCIFAEMVLGRPLFSGESELEQLLAIFRVMGTPTAQTWPKVSELRDWHEFPQWRPQNLAESSPGLTKLGEQGMDLLEQMIQLAPDKRISAVDALNSPYFDDIRDQYQDENAPRPLIHREEDKENDRMINDA